ncbi:MAG: hypothetical protein J6C76_08635 [Oscillospiraceae bacterium]|nr:hypothetical protein [Oscillospiraceae bacterium]MBP1571952.1 hypothetical protein [Oscillospiraceae bacterium]
MKKTDFLFVYEVKNRELENITLLAAELQRRGFSVAFLNSWQCLDGKFEDYDAEVVVVSACYTTDTYKFFTRHAARFRKVVNLQWEQVLRNGYAEADGATSWDFSGEALRTRHICWGENTKNRLMAKYNVAEEFLKICGYISLDFYRDEFKPFIKTKDELFGEFGLDTDKTTSLFISSFAIATMPKENMGTAPGNFNEVFVQNTIDSQKAVLDWFGTACKEYPDHQFIYRAHPSESDNPVLLKLAQEIPNFFYISKYPVKHWIVNCDKIYNWTSTSAAEVYAAGKQAFIVEPVPVDHRVTYPFFEGGETVKTYDEFKATVEMDVNTPNQPLDTAKFSECYMQTDTPVYKNLCDVLEETFRSTTYSCQNYYPTNSRKEREFEANYSKFWNSRTNILLVKLAKATSWNISLLNNRRDKEIPDRANTAKLKKYYAGRTKANAVSQQEIDGLIAKFRTIIG